MLSIVRIIGDRTLRLLIITGLGLALGACSKCAVPDFSHWWGNPAGAPASCQGDPPAQ
jgi:hypothetical protein